MPRLSHTIMLLMLGALLVLSPAAGAGAQFERVTGSNPDIVLPDIQGRQRALSEFAGSVVIVHFWASWCAPCVREFPELLRLRDAFRDLPLAVVGINVAEGERRARTAARRLGLDFPVLLDRDSRMFDAWGATVIPATYILDRGGELRFQAHGPVRWDAPEIVDRLTALMR